MSSYGKKSYWNERYSHETEPAEWIINGYSIFQHLLTPKYLCHSSAPPPGGEITVRALKNWCGSTDLLLTHGGGVGGEEDDARQSSSPITVLCFPKKDKCKVLNVGCGNSQLGEHMLLSGFSNIVNVDYSEVVIQQMNEKYDSNFFVNLTSRLQREEQLRNSLGIPLESRDDSNLNAANNIPSPKMTFEVADITTGEGMHQYADGSFDLIIVKKTLDIVLAGSGSVSDAKSMMSECYRLLNADHGVLLILSSAKPEDRAFFFEQDPWSGVENIRLPSKEDGQWEHRKGHERKTINAYAYLLYKQSWRN